MVSMGIVLGYCSGLVSCPVIVGDGGYRGGVVGGVGCQFCSFYGLWEYGYVR